MQVPLPVQFNCRNPQPLNGVASKSAAAQQYVNELKYSIGDGWSPVLNGTAKGDHNESWALGLTWKSNCIESTQNVPECEMLFDAPFRASGGAQIRRTPAGGSVTFDKCSIFFDSTFLNSTTCFQVWSPMQILAILGVEQPMGCLSSAGLAATAFVPLSTCPCYACSRTSVRGLDLASRGIVNSMVIVDCFAQDRPVYSGGGLDWLHLRVIIFAITSPSYRFNFPALPAGGVHNCRQSEGGLPRECNRECGLLLQLQ